MPPLRTVSLWPLRPVRARMAHGIDLGGGRLVHPEDLLEGHYRRLAAPGTPPQDVEVQVRPDLSATIRVVAPSLAPLTQVAEELAVKLTGVSPSPQFRAELLRALEAEHTRRLAAGQPAPRIQGTAWAIAALIAAAGLTAVALWLLRKHR